MNTACSSVEMYNSSSLTTFYCFHSHTVTMITSPESLCPGPCRPHLCRWLWHRGSFYLNSATPSPSPSSRWKEYRNSVQGGTKPLILGLVKRKKKMNACHCELSLSRLSSDGSLSPNLLFKEISGMAMASPQLSDIMTLLQIAKLLLSSEWGAVDDKDLALIWTWTHWAGNSQSITLLNEFLESRKYSFPI